MVGSVNKNKNDDFDPLGSLRQEKDKSTYIDDLCGPIISFSFFLTYLCNVIFVTGFCWDEGEDPLTRWSSQRGRASGSEDR